MSLSHSLIPFIKLYLLKLVAGVPSVVVTDLHDHDDHDEDDKTDDARSNRNDDVVIVPTDWQRRGRADLLRIVSWWFFFCGVGVWRQNRDRR